MDNGSDGFRKNREERRWDKKHKKDSHYRVGMGIEVVDTNLMSVQEIENVVNREGPPPEEWDKEQEQE